MSVDGLGQDGKVKIGLAYIVAKGRDQKWNVFFHPKREFEEVEGRSPKIVHAVEEFNYSSGGVSVHNFLNIVNNLSPISGEHWVEQDGRKYHVHVESIDAPPIVEEVNEFPFGSPSRA